MSADNIIYIRQQGDQFAVWEQSASEDPHDEPRLAYAIGVEYSDTLPDARHTAEEMESKFTSVEYGIEVLSPLPPADTMTHPLKTPIRLKRDDRPPRLGWSPGKYACCCLQCCGYFEGAKKCDQCADCAYAMPVEAIEKASLNDAKEILFGQIDPNVEAVRAKLLQRSQVGLAKYGCTTEALTPLQAIRHAQEEALDLAVYLEAAIRQMEGQG